MTVLFRNPWPHSQPHNWREVLRFFAELPTRGRVESPRRGSFPVSTPTFSYPRADDTALTATWIGHSTVLLQLGGINALTDPVFSQRASPVQWMGPRRVMDPGLALDALPPLDVVLLSHNHYDHLDKPAVQRIASAHPQTTWIVPLGLGAYIRRWGARDIVELDWWQQAAIKGLRVTALRRGISAVEACTIGTGRSGADSPSNWKTSAYSSSVIRPITPSLAGLARSAVRST
jgi:N-acyl-phosphatidylethanolamine-hydrolysing phospholipase D